LIDIRFGRCEQHGRLSVQRLLARYGPDASLRDIMRDGSRSARRPGAGTNRSGLQPYCRTMAERFGVH